MQTYFVPFTRRIYIDRSDFREEGSKSFFRLSTGGSVGLLKVPFPITATSCEKDPATGLVTAVRAKYNIPDEGATFKKPKAYVVVYWFYSTGENWVNNYLNYSYIHWVADSPVHNSPRRIDVHVFNRLFKSANPAAHPDGFLADINRDSEEIFSDALLDVGFEEMKRRAPWPKIGLGGNAPAEELNGPESVRFQGMRVGYFCEDTESKPDKLVLNRIVALKEDPGKA